MVLLSCWCPHWHTLEHKINQSSKRWVIVDYCVAIDFYAHPSIAFLVFKAVCYHIPWLLNSCWGSIDDTMNFDSIKTFKYFIGWIVNLYHWGMSKIHYYCSITIVMMASIGCHHCDGWHGVPLSWPIASDQCFIHALCFIFAELNICNTLKVIHILKVFDFFKYFRILELR